MWCCARGLKETWQYRKYLWFSLLLNYFFVDLSWVFLQSGRHKGTCAIEILDAVRIVAVARRKVKTKIGRYCKLLKIISGPKVFRMQHAIDFQMSI